MKKPSIIVVLVLLLAATYFSYIKYQDHKFLTEVSSDVKFVTVRLTHTIEAGKTNASFNEVIEKIQNSIAEVDKKAVQLQTIKTAKNKSVVEPAVAYIASSQNLLRSLLYVVRANLSAQTTSELSTKYVTNPKSYPATLSHKMLEEFGKAIDEYKKALSDVRSSSQSMKDSVSATALIFEKDILINTDLLDELIAGTQKTPEQKKQ